MTPLLIAMAATALSVAALIVLPVWRARQRAPRAAVELAIYRDQLGEIERDLERGLLRPAEAKAARIEVEHRLLRAGRRAGGDAEQPAGPSRAGRVAAVVAACLAPVAAIYLYTDLGRPSLPDQPLATRAPAAEDPQMAAIGRMVAGLEQRLKEHPDDLAGWLRLGRSRLVLNDPDAALVAYRKAVDLKADDPEALGGLGEALTRVAGTVTPDAQQAFEQLRKAAPGDPRALYYLGLAAAEAGDGQGAIDRWRELLGSAPAEAPWRGQIEESIRRAAREAGLDPARALADLPAPPAAPDDADRQEAARIAALPPDEQAAAIHGMVDQLQARLERDGGNAEGWQRLAQARLMLGDATAAQAAFAKAAQLAPDDAAILTGYGQSLVGPVDAKTRLPTVGDQAAAVFAKAASLAPGQPVPLWFLGIHALQSGRPDEARAQWTKVLGMLEPGQPDYAAVKQQIDQIGG